MAKDAGKVSEADIRAVADLFARVSAPRDMRRMLDEILTPAELRDLALRWPPRSRRILFFGSRTVHLRLRWPNCGET